MVEVPLEEMAHEADAIVVGTITRSSVRFVAEDGRFEPHTFSTLRVEEWIHGPGGESIVIDEVGGEYRGRDGQSAGMRVDGVPTYRVGDRVVVFLRRVGNAYCTVAMAQGAFFVVPGVPGVADTVVRDTSAMSFASWASGAMTLHAGGAVAMRLDDFLGRVRGLVEQLRVDGASSGRTR